MLNKMKRWLSNIKWVIALLINQGGVKVILIKLFDSQKALRNRIGYEGPDRFEKLINSLFIMFHKKRTN